MSYISMALHGVTKVEITTDTGVTPSKITYALTRFRFVTHDGTNMEFTAFGHNGEGVPVVQENKP